MLTTNPNPRLHSARTWLIRIGHRAVAEYRALRENWVSTVLTIAAIIAATLVGALVGKAGW
jgi:hypothetical protein